MAAYDSGWYHPFERGAGGRRRRYGESYGFPGWGGSGPEGGWSWGAGRAWPGRGFERDRGGGDRGAYGSDYPGYGGYPGARQRGTIYGGGEYDGAYSARVGQWRGGSVRSAFAPGRARTRSPDDGELRVAVRQSLFNDSWLDAGNIDVEVQDGVVTLTGRVADYMQARYAWDDAWETNGVRGVIDRLAVGQDDASSSEETADRPA